jgi:hypothetical protein
MEAGMLQGVLQAWMPRPSDGFASTFLAEDRTPRRSDALPTSSEKICAESGLISFRLPSHGYFVPEACGAVVILEQDEARAERRLRDSETRGRAAKMNFLGERDKVAEMAQFHSYLTSI